MANITRYNPFEDLFKDFGKGFWLRPVAFPAETEDGVLNLTLPKKSNGSAKRIAVS